MLDALSWPGGNVADDSYPAPLARNRASGEPSGLRRAFGCEVFGLAPLTGLRACGRAWLEGNRCAVEGWGANEGLCSSLLKINGNRLHAVHSDRSKRYTI
jgi:hypothetical protein